MKFKFFCLFLFLANSIRLIAQEETETRLPFQLVAIGVDSKILNGNYRDTSFVQNLKTKLYGISAQLQSSFIIGYLSQRKRRFMIGDILQSQLGLGFYQTNNPDIVASVLPYYQFDFGIRSIYKINKNNEIGADIFLLSFGRDRVSPNTSGSSFAIRYRYNRHILSIGIKARRDRIFGWLQQYLSPNFSVPPQYIFSYAYSYKKSNIGIHVDYMYDKYFTYTQFHINPIYNFNVRLFYGVYF